MKPSSQPPRTPSRLSDSVHHQLGQYALAASAAGVGVLALTQSAEAKIVYTATHRHVRLNRPWNVDLNGDGIVDFRIYRSTFWDYDQTTGTFVSARGVSQPNGVRNRVAGLGYTGRTSGGQSFYYISAYPLDAGRQVGAKLNFPNPSQAVAFMAVRGGFQGIGAYCAGKWNNLKNRYLGLEFVIKGKTHYGWARVNESCNRVGPIGRCAVTVLTGYAYETVADKPIVAGKTKGPDATTVHPASLGQLAQGSAGLAARPRQESGKRHAMKADGSRR